MVNSLDWRRYQLKDIEKAPLSVVVNVTSTYIPYTSAGKTAIADESEIRREIELALMECARNVKRYLAQKRRRHERRTRKLILVRYVPEVAKAIEDLTGKKKAEVEAMLMQLINKKYEDVGAEEDEEVEGAEERGEAEGEIEKEYEEEVEKEIVGE